ncbi:MAG: hypothetical protein ABIC91_07515 [Nanoarchaeota archaeon]|nr:hypothetical protein [Nanoarchaeota archaeon]
MRWVLSSFNIKKRVLICISNFLQFLILIALFSSIIAGRLDLSLLSFACLLISYLPFFIKKRYGWFLPPEFELAFVFFLYGSFVLGEMRSFYFRYPWWDIFLHSFSAIMLALIGFMLIYSLYITHKVVFSPVFAALFCFCFALALGASWEIFEFSADSFLGLNMQKSGLADTMCDLIVDAGGALIVAVSGYFYLRGGESLIINRIVKKFVDLNKHRFKKTDDLI